MALLRRRRDAADYCQEALRRSRAGDHAGFLAAADQAIRIAPGHAMAHHLRGGALSDQGRHSEALAEFRQAIALDPAMTYVQYRIAFELNFLGRSDEALQAADTAIGLDPGDVAPLILRGAILSDLDRPEEALDAFTEVLRRRPDIAQVYFNRAQILRRLGRYPEALAGYDEALRLLPRLPGGHEHKGITLAMAGEYDGALAEFGLATAPGAGRPAGTAPAGTADVWPAAIAWHRGDRGQARRRFEQAAATMAADRSGSRSGSPFEAVNLRAVVSCALGDPGAAEDLLREQAHPADPGARDVLSRLYDLLSDPPMPGIGQLRAIAFRSLT